MAKITGSKTTKAAETASLKKARTQHRIGMGQLMTQPNALAAREEAKRVLAEALAAGVDGREEQAAVDFVKGPAPVEAQAAMTHVRLTAPYNRRAAAPQDVPGFTVEVEKGWHVRTGDGLVTEKQAKWMISIAHRPSITDEMRVSLQVRLEQGFARGAASAFITKYKHTPKAPKVTAAMAEAIAPGASIEEVEKMVAAEEAPAGRYALRGEDGVVKFYRLDRPTQGKWAGWTFLKVQASDDLHTIKSRTEKARIIADISADVEGSARLYGQELGRCYACGRTLTDETSRSLGIGPDCRNK